MAYQLRIKSAPRVSKNKSEIRDLDRDLGKKLLDNSERMIINTSLTPSPPIYKFSQVLEFSQVEIKVSRFRTMAEILGNKIY